MDFSKMLKIINDNKELLELIYVDTLQPGAKQVGFALENILKLGNTVLLPIRYLNGVAEINFKESMRKYQQKFDSIDIEQMNQVPPEIGVEILEKFKIVQSEKIRDLYINILASASMKESYPDVHPKIVKTIELFTPDEAIIIEKLSLESVYIMKIVLKEIIKPKRKTANYGLEIPEESISYEQNSMFSNVDGELNYKENTTVYFENLIEWGVVKLKRCNPTDTHEKLQIDNAVELERMNEELIKSESQQIELLAYELVLTEFGKRLISVCISE